MKTRRNLLFALPGLVALSGALLLFRSAASAQSAANSTSQSVPVGNAQRGKAIYGKVGCWECHGFDAQSGGNGGPKLGPPPMPFGAFVNQLRNPRNQMPPYTAKVLPDADVADIYSFIQTLPQPPKAQSIPILK